MHARTEAASETVPEAGPSWPEEIFGILQRFDVRQVPYVPDAGHSQLIERVLGASSMRGIPLTTEEEGVALLAGAWAGGQRGVLLMQSSGVGNCVNMFALLRNCGFPCLLLVTMRGEFAEFNPWQVPMGSITEDCLKLCGFQVYRAVKPEEVDDIVGAASDMAFDGNLAVAVVLSQRLIGRKQWVR